MALCTYLWLINLRGLLIEASSFFLLRPPMADPIDRMNEKWVKQFLAGKKKIFDFFIKK
jgi:hypothetical protein